MTARRFVLAVLAALALHVAVVVGANATFDPYGTLGTRAEVAGLNIPHVLWRRFLAEGRDADTFVFGSGRAQNFCDQDVAALLPGARVFNFGFAWGAIHEHHAHLRAALAAGAGRLRTVVLVLDLQYFGLPPMPPRADRRLHPQVTGERSARVALDALGARLAGPSLGEIRAVLTGRPRYHARGCPTAAARALTAADIGDRGELEDDPAASRFEVFRVTARPGFATALAELERFAALVTARGARLVVLLSPIGAGERRYYRGDDLAAAAARLGRAVPLWRFGEPRWLAADPRHWSSPSHFAPHIARAMLAAALGDGAAPAGFGERLGR